MVNCAVCHCAVYQLVQIKQQSFVSCVTRPSQSSFNRASTVLCARTVQGEHQSALIVRYAKLTVSVCVVWGACLTFI